MRRKLIISCIVLLSLSGWVVYFRWSSAIRQPLNFSHSRHVKAGIQCSTCHLSLDELPSTSECKSCHAGESFPVKIQWTRVYRIAPDIIFTHGNHMDAPCSTCHSQLTTAKIWIHESRFKMDFCMKCHEEKDADNRCGTCHKNR